MKVFPLVVTALLVGIFFQPYVFADDVESTIVVPVEIPYGNGIDDNGDGIIDDLNESDISYGNVPMNTTQTVFDTWFTNISFEIDGQKYNYTMENGVRIGAYFENLAKFMPNESVAPTKWCYVAYVDYYPPIDEEYYKIESDVVPIIKYYVRISSGDIMNGAQEMWHRSPIKWDSSKFDQLIIHDDNGKEIVIPKHYLNIYDSQGNLVFATTKNFSFYGEVHSVPNIVINNRVYTYINCYFRSNETYTFIEYIKTRNDDPIRSFELYFAPNQDIAADNLTKTIIYPDTDAAKLIEDNGGNTIEAGWSMIFQIGIGRAGTEKLIKREPGSFTSIFTQLETGYNINHSNKVTIVIPFRTTEPVKIYLFLYVKSGDNITVAPGGNPAIIRNVTGTIIHTFNFTDPDPTKINKYALAFFITESHSNETQYCTYLMIPANVTHNVNGIGVCGFAFYFEIQNETYDPSAEEKDDSVNWLTVLIGLDVIVGSYFGIAFSGPFGSITWYISSKLFIPVGTYIMYLGFQGAPPEVIINALKNQTVRFLKGIAEGVKWLGEQLWKVIKYVIQIVIKAGQVILKAIGEIIYFVASIVVIYLWYKFLHWMRLIALHRWSDFAAEVEGTAGRLRGFFRR